jgi:hypothetical protein
MRVFVMENDTMIADHQFGAAAVLVGSGPDCAIRIPDWRVAAAQLRLIPDEADQWRVEVLDPKFPTHLNGSLMRDISPLKDLDEISVGPFVLKVYFSLNAKDAPARPDRRAAAAPVDRVARPAGALITRVGNSVLALTQLTADLVAIEQVDALVQTILHHLLAMLQASVACVCVRQRTTTGLEFSRAMNTAGKPVDRPALADLLNEACMRHRDRICLPDTERTAPATAMAVPILGTRSAVLGMLYVERADPQQRFNRATLDLFMGFAAAVAWPLERAVTGVETARAAIRDHEAAVARQVQDAITPRAMPEWQDLHIAAYRRPGTTRCCDYWDVLRLANGTVSLLAARVDAGGAMLPRLLSEIRAAFRVSCLHTDPPHVLARAINWLISDMQPPSTIDLACAWVLPGDGGLKYCVAGAVSGGVIGADGNWRELEGGANPPIGRVRGHAYLSKADRFDPGDVLVLITPGADALRNQAGEQFGRARTAECLNDTAGMAINLMLADLVQELNEFAETGACPDDVTLVLAQRMG